MQNRIYAADNEMSRSSKIAGTAAIALLNMAISVFFASFTHSIACAVFVIVEAALLTVVLSALEKKTTASQIFRAAAVILFAVWIMLDMNGIRRAMVNSFNIAISYVNEAFSRDYVSFGVQEASGGDYIALYAILTAIAVMAVNAIMKRRSVILLTLITFILLISALTLRVDALYLIVPFAVIGWAGCWSKCTDGTARSMLYIATALAAVFAVGTAVLAMSGFGGFKVLDDFHEDVDSFIYKTRYGEDSLPKGDLFKADTMLKGEGEVLRVTFKEPETVYLKGFTGGSFEENKWIEYKEDAYLGEWGGMLDYFNISKFGPNNIYAQYCEADGKDDELNVITVENNGADRSYIYLPFTAAIIEDVGAYSNRDLGIRSGGFFGTKKYTFANVKLDTKPELLSLPQWVEGSNDEAKAEFLKKENVYRAFVKDTYLDIDAKTKSEIDEVFFKDFDKDLDEAGVYTITTRIRSILKLTASYTQTPQEPQDKDFIGWFLAGYKKGNSAYFTTAAVMAYRAAGIPARYAEGYYVSDVDVENLNMTQKNSISLTAENAHAWVEIYRDGMGWVRIEVTPGFYVEDSQDMEIIDIARELEAGGAAGAGERYNSSLSMYSPEKASVPEDRMSSSLRIVLMLVCLLTIATMIIYIRYLVLIYLKTNRIYNLTTEENTNYMMMYLCAALNADGVEANPDNIAALKKELLGKYGVFTEFEFERMSSLISRSSYGGARLREHELRTIRIFIEKLSAEIYKGKSFFKKLVLRYIKIV